MLCVHEPTLTQGVRKALAGCAMGTLGSPPNDSLFLGAASFGLGKLLTCSTELLKQMLTLLLACNAVCC